MSTKSSKRKNQKEAGRAGQESGMENIPAFDRPKNLPAHINDTEAAEELSLTDDGLSPAERLSQTIGGQATAGEPPQASGGQAAADGHPQTDRHLLAPGGHPLAADGQATADSSTAEPPLPMEDQPPSHGSRRTKPQPTVPVSRWFVTFMCMNIPIIGWLYLIILALNPSKGPRRDFAKAYLIYKLVFLLLSLAILAVALHYGLEVLDKLLAYMEML